MKVNKVQLGFTLLELVVVLAVTSILTASLIYSIPKWQEQPRLAVATEMGRAIQQGMIAWCSQQSYTVVPDYDNTQAKVPPFVKKGAKSWNSLDIPGTSSVTPTFSAGAICGNSDKALAKVEWEGGCADGKQNIVYTVETNTATCE